MQEVRLALDRRPRFILLGVELCALIQRLPHPVTAQYHRRGEKLDLSPLLAGQVPPCEEALDWLQFP